MNDAADHLNFGKWAASKYWEADEGGGAKPQDQKAVCCINATDASTQNSFLDDAYICQCTGYTDSVTDIVGAGHKKCEASGNLQNLHVVSSVARQGGRA